MAVKRENKHEVKTRETRALLLSAAETIFVRDGYEGAELGEIAALAGRTKGAIYAQFASKEDIFLALMEHRMRCYRMQMEEVLAKSLTIEENLASLRSFYLHRAEDIAWSLLTLEFKLFAMRHPASKKRLQHLVSSIISLESEQKYASLLGVASKSKDAVSRVVAVQALGPMICGLVLEAQLAGDVLDKKAIQRVANRLFDALLEPNRGMS